MIRLIEFQKISGLQMKNSIKWMQVFFYSVQTINYGNEVHVVAL